MKRIAVIAVVLSVLFPPGSRADIYRWEDETGAAHFTDDPSNIPPAYRGKATTVIREAPRGPEPPPPAPGRPDAAAPQPAPAPSREDEEALAAREKESLVSQIEQLKAKIAAKEKHIQLVEERQNLVLNPLRARVLDPGDVELYRKYQAELPEDRKALQELETRFESIR
jgi:hypothetical protein